MIACDDMSTNVGKMSACVVYIRHCIIVASQHRLKGPGEDLVVANPSAENPR